MSKNSIVISVVYALLIFAVNAVLSTLTAKLTFLLTGGVFTLPDMAIYPVDAITLFLAIFAARSLLKELQVVRLPLLSVFISTLFFFFYLIPSLKSIYTLPLSAYITSLFVQSIEIFIVSLLFSLKESKSQ